MTDGRSRDLGDWGIGGRGLSVESEEDALGTVAAREDCSCERGVGDSVWCDSPVSSDRVSPWMGNVAISSGDCPGLVCVEVLRSVRAEAW